jgi:hypothetical protein
MRVTAIAGLLLIAGRLASAADAPCDRACLKGFVDQYLAALVAHDPSKLPVTATARYTENGQTLKLGDGMWGPVIAMGTYKLYFADPKAGQTGFFGNLEEHGHPAILGLRLKIENRKISEMETIVIRSTARGSFSSPQDLKDQPALNEIVPAAERNTRDQLVTIANSYFEGLEKATDRYTPFDKNCKRIENGVITSNDPTSKSEITRMSCGAQFATGFSKIITNVRDRRFPIVDEERGLVYTVIRFDHNGKNKTTVWNDGSTHPVNTPFDEPFSFEIGELFKIRNGKIQQIEALVLNVPYGMPTGWGKKE